MRQSGKDLNKKPMKSSRGCEWADLLDDQRISHMASSVGIATRKSLIIGTYLGTYLSPKMVKYHAT